MNSTNFYAASAFFNGLFGLFVVYYLYMRNRQNSFNLMVNACQAMGEEGGNLSLRAKKEQSGVTLEVVDSGPGMSKEQQKKAFEPFYSTKQLKGSGLGLYIAKQLVERNGGKIELKSKAGQGSVFSLRFQAVSK